MKIIKILCLVVFSAFFMAGCSVKKAEVKGIYSEGLDSIVLKDIYILDFKRDTVNMADALYVLMDNSYMKNQKVYDVQRRKNLTITFNDNNYKRELDLKKADKQFRRYYITGRILNSDFSTREDINEKVDMKGCLKYDYGKHICTAYKTYYEYCSDYNYSLGVDVTVRDVDTNDIIFTKVYSKDKNIKDCSTNKYKTIPSLSSNLDILAAEISNEIVQDFSPRKKTYYIEFIDTPDVRFSEDEKNLLENAINTFDRSKDESASLFSDLVDLTDNTSSVAYFNLALVLESQEKNNKAYKYYRKALKIASGNEKVDDRILDSIERIERKLSYRGI